MIHRIKLTRTHENLDLIDVIDHDGDTALKISQGSIYYLAALQLVMRARYLADLVKELPDDGDRVLQERIDKHMRKLRECLTDAVSAELQFQTNERAQ